MNFYYDKLRIINYRQGLKSHDNDQALAKKNEEEAEEPHQRDGEAGGGSSGVIEGRSFADTVKN